jgi:hypothetical protein
MSYFRPAIIVSGYGGWRVLEKTAPKQREVFERSPGLLRDIEYFRENIAKAKTAEDLVKDRRLLTVALGAFGLGDEINKRAFIQRILEGGTDNSDSFANRLNEPRYKAMAKAFGYGNVAGAKVELNSFQDDIVARFKSLEFERAVGEVDGDMRIAMNFKREILAIASGESVDRAGWLQAMGQLPVRTLLTTAFGLPDSVAQLDIDRQKEMFETKAEQLYGDSSAKVFLDPENVEDIIRRFFLFKQMKSGPNATTPGMGALTMLQSSALGAGAALNLLMSQA